MADTKAKYLIAIDLSLCNTGVAVFCNKEVIHTETIKTVKTKGRASDVLMGRCKRLIMGLRDVINTYPLDKISIAVEVPSGSKSSSAMKSLSAAVGAFSSLMVMYPNIDFTLLTPQNIKKFVGSPDIKGPTRKKLNIKKAEELYPTAPYKRNNQGAIQSNQEHICDSVLIGHICLNRLN